MVTDPRLALERLCAERGEDFAGLSKMLGRNSAYVQQFVRRGVPRRLHEEDRRRLARYFAVPESLLGGPPDQPADPDGLVRINRHPVSVSAGPGAIVSEERGRAYFGFDERWLKGLTQSPPGSLSIVRVEGDSMAPTLSAGDDILVDLGDATGRLRDGIYVLRVDDAVVVKRDGRSFKPQRRRSICHSSTAMITPVAVPISTPFIGLPIASPATKPPRMQMVRKHPPARVVRLGIAALHTFARL